MSVPASARDAHRVSGKGRARTFGPFTLLSGSRPAHRVSGKGRARTVDVRYPEIAYAVPGVCERVRWAKLADTATMLLVAEALLAVPTGIFFAEPLPLDVLYRAMQSAVFYMVLAMAMALAILSRGEVAGVTATVAVLGFNGLVTGFGVARIRVSSSSTCLRPSVPPPSTSSREPSRTGSA